ADARGALSRAAFEGHKDAVTTLLDRGADVGAKMQDGGTPLHAACTHGHAPVVQLLLDKGSDVNLRMLSGATPFSRAV
ncbi:ankyrin repeat protein, partial [Baffinella frigidus]